jgi:glycosyltransferase involved in cell wall biosynthesis
MKVVIATGIYPPDIGGPATYTRTMARELSRCGNRIEVVCYADDESRVAVEPRDEKFSVTRISRKQPTWKRYLAYALAVRRLAKNADIVYLQGPVSEGFPGTIGAMLAGKPTVMKIVGDYAWEMYMQKGSPENKELLDEFVTHTHAEVRWLERIERWTAKQAKQVIVPSAYLKGIVEGWGVPGGKVEVIYNSVNPPTEGLSRDEARKQFGIEDRRAIFTAVRAVPWKNIDFIIGLLPELPLDIIFAIAGDGPSLGGWKEEAKRLGVEERVKFLGKLDRAAMGSWYRAADLFVLPSGYEGYPNVIPEAWSQGLPCFVSNKAGNQELHAFGTSYQSDIEPFRKLSYLDRDEWLSAMNGVWPKRFPGWTDDRMNLKMMCDKTNEILISSVLDKRV